MSARPMMPIDAEAREQIAKAVEAAAGLDDLDGLPPDELAGIELDDRQQYAREFAGLIRSWPAEASTGLGLVPPGSPDIREVSPGACREAVLAAERGETTVIRHGDEPVVMVVRAPDPAPAPERGQMTTVALMLAVPAGTSAALDRRDDIIRWLAHMGIRLSMSQGLQANLADAGVPTLGDLFTGGPS